MTLIREGDTVFSAFADSQGPSHYYAQVQIERAGAEATELEEQHKRAEAEKQAWLDRGIDPNVFRDDAVEIAQSQGQSWQQFVLEGLGISLEWHRAESEKSRQLAENLGYSATVIEHPDKQLPPEQSSLQIGIAYTWRPRKRRLEAV